MPRKKKEVIEVYRIERNGRGPFTSSHRDQIRIKHDTIDYSMPAPWDDRELNTDFNVKHNKNCVNDSAIEPFWFGCVSKKDILQWIKDVELLARYGFKITKYLAKKTLLQLVHARLCSSKRHLRRLKRFAHLNS